MPTDSENLAEIVTEAEKAASIVSNLELRKIAFDRILEHLLQTGFHPVGKIKTVKTSSKTKTPKDLKAKPGTKTWLEELIDDDFFKTPKSGKDILKALDERGHILKSTDITMPLSLLVNDKKLRRRKMTTEGSKSQLHWHNW